MILEDFTMASFEKNIDAESPKNEKNKNKTNNAFIALFLMKKIIKKKGTYKRFNDFKKKASSEVLPITVKTINRNKAPTNSLLNLNFETFSMTHILKQVAQM